MKKILKSYAIDIIQTVLLVSTIYYYLSHRLFSSVPLVVSAILLIASVYYTLNKKTAQRI